MKVTILWEDQRSRAIKGFEAGKLLEACLCDRRELPVGTRLAIEHLPKKGNGAVIAAMKREFGRLGKLGPVLAVLDRDRIHGLWAKDPPTNCILGVRTRIVQDCDDGGWRESRDIVLLVDNMESLVDACLQARQRGKLHEKPNPDERDRWIGAVVWGDPPTRKRVLELCPSFARLVDRVDAVLPA